MDEKKIQELMKMLFEGLATNGPLTVKLSIEDKSESVEISTTISCTKKN